ncbi:MAG: UDP-N-acetylmuramoyl-L-alanyl-D-glutamate--2,6-diaminopimelate ligase [Bacteroidota bacterium]|nr:MAG: UDP-N-acetylmuramoyl-L-alanyl-D-glutamate--2,6-diaminopimelate ligase [Bacteroidota bacterium]
MKRLNEIATNFEFALFGNGNMPVERIVFDSRQVRKGDLFVALRGTAHDGHIYIPEVIEKGVDCIVCEQLPEESPEGVCFLKVKDSHAAIGHLASNFYGNPSSKLELVGVTGTNGKTSIATLLYQLFTKLGYQSGLLSTVRNLIGEVALDSTHTTPDAVSLNKLLADMVDAGCKYAFMEVSSHAIDQRRIAGLQFRGGIFSNITHDHLDYHKTFDAYIKAKKQFFDELPSDAFALVNIDDKHGRVMVQNTRARVLTYSINHVSDFKAKILESHFDGTKILLNQSEVWTQLIGQFNVSNLLAIYGAASLLLEGDLEILPHLSALKTVEGRFQYLRSKHGVTAIVDYAHTPDALLNVLSTINSIRKGNEQLITVVGAGGNRDKTKRPVMAKIAVRESDRLILTSDNPRNENPQSIIDDMMAGVESSLHFKVLSILDRREAIRAACMMARPGDILLVAGKGHENYQEIMGVKIHFSDQEVISEIFMSNIPHKNA